MGRLDGKIAIITGAASGIGKTSVELFRSEGATVIGADVSDGADIRCDAGSEDDVKHLVDQVVAEHGQIDVFFANAGVSGGFASISEQSAADWAEILRVNLIGPFLAVKYAGARMKERGGGSIICTASVAGLRSGAGGAAYSASKAGVINLAATAAQQLSGTGVRVNAIAPGHVGTETLQSRLDERRRAIAAETPAGRLGRPEEMAATVAFLASDDAAYYVGATLSPNGGSVMY